MANLISNLEKLGVKNIICCKKGSEMSRYAKKNNIDFFELPFKGLKIKDGLLFKKQVKSLEIDLIHTHTANGHTVAFYASLFGCRPPIIVSKRTDFEVKSPWKFNNKSVAKVLCVSNKIKEIAASRITDKEKLVTVYSGINPKRFDTEQEDLKDVYNLQGKPLIGNCSAIAQQKDYFTFLKVAKRMPEANFIIIGSGPMEKEIKAYAAELEVQNVLFTGFLKDIEKKLSSLDCFLITSETEGLGTSILDAMLCEVPVVATNAGGIPEIVINRKTGMLSEVRDVDSLVKDCKEVLSRESLRKDLVQEAKKMVLENFIDMKTAEKTHSIYQDVLKDLAQ